MEVVITIAAFVLAVITIVFTSQGREIVDNVRYQIGRAAHGVWRRSLQLDSGGLPHSGDRSQFVADITVPDGTSVKVNTRFTKTWEIRNVGSVVWENRYLERQGTVDGKGRLKSAARTRIPYTEPGHSCRISIPLTAPALPGSCYAEWKMTDANGQILLPNQKPVYVSVDVIE